MRPNWDTYFLDVADVVATRADCTRRRCAAVIVKNKRIVSTGYNGSPAGDERSCLEGDCPRGRHAIEDLPGYQQGNNDYAQCIAIHAEANAIAYANRSDCEGATIFMTGPPCDMCGKLIKAAGIVRAIWRENV